GLRRGGISRSTAWSRRARAVRAASDGRGAPVSSSNPLRRLGIWLAQRNDQINAVTVTLWWGSPPQRRKPPRRTSPREAGGWPHQGGGRLGVDVTVHRSPRRGPFRRVGKGSGRTRNGRELPGRCQRGSWRHKSVHFGPPLTRRQRRISSLLGRARQGRTLRARVCVRRSGSTAG